MAPDVSRLESLNPADLKVLLEFRRLHGQLQALTKDRDSHLREVEKIQGEIERILGSQIPLPARPIRRKEPRRSRPAGPTLRQAAREVLKGRTGGLTVAEVRDEVVKRYPHRGGSSLYNQVFVALSQNPEFRRLKDKKYVLSRGG